jgi:hypothetical protein
VESPDEPQAALKRLSHDVKNALHGVSVNLEVARTRAARGVTDLTQVTPFLESAAQQLDLAVKLHKQFADLAAELARPLTDPLHASEQQQ